MVQRLVDAVAGPAALADQLAAVAAQLAQLAERARRHIAGPAQAELADAGQPQAVGHVALAAFDLLDELGMQQQRLDARVLEGLKGSLPENARALQRCGRHAMARQPLGQTAQPGRQGAELAGGALHAATRLAQPHRGGDLHLVDVESGGAGVHDMQRVGLHVGAAADCGCHGVSSLQRRRIELARGKSLGSGAGARFTVRPGPRPGTLRGSKGRSDVSLENEVGGRSPRHHCKLRSCTRLRYPPC